MPDHLQSGSGGKRVRVELEAAERVRTHERRLEELTGESVRGVARVRTHASAVDAMRHLDVPAGQSQPKSARGHWLDPVEPTAEGHRSGPLRAMGDSMVGTARSRRASLSSCQRPGAPPKSYSDSAQNQHAGSPTSRFSRPRPSSGGWQISADVSKLHDIQSVR